jgi:Putative glycosyl/glycerophosphate transferases involved in teichoic acid biosynthesis TagF/TagB/EpsJ/RodC
MSKHYLFFVSLTYSYSILRPLQKEILRRGDQAAWFIEEPCEDKLVDGELRLYSIDEVMEYNPIAVFAPGNWVYDFFPGVKVEVFHGYAMKKRIEKIDDHFTIRGWFDIYCTQGPSSTTYFKELEKKHGFFKVYETGWCKVDPFFEKRELPQRARPVILYSSTFSRNITSAPYLLETITQLAETKSWDWIITFHPKLDNPDLIEKYKHLAETHENVTFCSNYGLNTLEKMDVLLCDSSSIIVEVLMLEKPVVTFRNTNPGNYLIDVLNENEIGDAIEKALTRPKELMENSLAYTLNQEAHRDGKNASRVLDAVDDFIGNYKGKIRKKPLNLIRKIKIRLKAKYYRF